MMPSKKVSGKPAATTKTGRTKKKSDTSKTGIKPPFVVGIGCSAGGLAALEAFFKEVPADLGAAYVVISHLDPKHPSLLPEILQKITALPIHHIQDGMPIKANEVFIIPPNADAMIFKNCFQLMATTKTRGLHMPIDSFFCSLAEDQKERAIGVILSGMGTDGTLGIKAIKKELGMVIAQQPESARSGSMPESVIATDLPDYVALPAEMPRIIQDYINTPRSPVELQAAKDGNLDKAMQKIFLLLRNRTGHDFSSYKPNTLYRRVSRRMNVHHFSDIDLYVRYLRKTATEVDLLFKELLIGVTEFFRDAEAFAVLKKRLIETTFKTKSAEDNVRVWVAGVSSGEEAYSIAMLLRECMEELDTYLHVQIFATDLDEEAIEFARAGIFPAGIKANVDPERLQRFFHQRRDINSYQIKKEIRESIIFATHNVIKDPPFTKLDLVSCRNLLIYLDAELQKKLLPLFHYSLNDAGLLFLGTSESIGGFTELFSPIDRKWKLFQRKHATRVLPHRGLNPAITHAKKTPTITTSSKTIVQLIEKQMMQAIFPPSAVINERGYIQYVHGDISPYLALPSGEIKELNIHDMIREGLRLELTAAIRKAITQNKKIVQEGMHVKSGDNSYHFNLAINPLHGTESTKNLLLVAFHTSAPALCVTQEQDKKSAKTSMGKAADKHLDILEQELTHTKNALQTAVEEMETSNEELKSANEELQSTNEELQSTNEELETSKEEQNSLNEELVIINAELQSKVEQLTKSANDMKNLLDSTEIPTVFLDIKLNIERFTSNLSRFGHFIPADIGRPLSDIVLNLNYPNLVEDVRQVLDTLIPHKEEAVTLDGCWYLVKIHPYRTLENTAEGVVITFIDIHEQKNTTGELIQLKHLFGNILDSLSSPHIVLDGRLHVIMANHAFFTAFQVSPSETNDQLLYQLGNGQWDIEELRELLETIIPKNNRVENFKVVHTFPHIGKRIMNLSAQKIETDVVNSSMILLKIDDITRNDGGQDNEKVQQS